MSKTLYVGNLPWAASEEQLANTFAAHGEVLSARIITDKLTGRSRGFGFVEVNEDQVEKMIEAMNGQELEGRELVVSEAKPRPE